MTRLEIQPFADDHVDPAATLLAARHARHAVFVPSFDRDLLDAWFRLSFGASAALATRETEPLVPFDARVAIRRSTPDDLVAAARLDRAMRESMRPSPSFSASDDWLE